LHSKRDPREQQVVNAGNRPQCSGSYGRELSSPKQGKLDNVRSDEELMTAYCAGDSSAFNELFRRYAPQLGAILRRFGFSQDRLADLVQQTFLQLHRARSDFRTGSELRPWLTTIAFNLAREQLRRAKRRPETEIDASTEAAMATLPREQSRFEIRRDLSRALQQLPEDQQEVVRLHFIEELSFEEIGAKMGATPGAVRVRAHRGYTALRKLLSVGSNSDSDDIDQETGS
jgi:RNA polymerase sigma-70 factor (ECF subfamily)